jgi:hypothetical protein
MQQRNEWLIAARGTIAPDFRREPTAAKLVSSKTSIVQDHAEAAIQALRSLS